MATIPTKAAGYVATAAAAGLAISHLTVYTVGFASSQSATWAQYLSGGVTISAIAGAFAVVAFILTRASVRRVTLTVLAWIACVVFGLQAILLVASADISLFGPDRPGTYSLIAAPAFGVLAWRQRHRSAQRPPSDKTTRSAWTR